MTEPIRKALERLLELEDKRWGTSMWEDAVTAARAALDNSAAPAPLASDVYFEFVVSDADYCTQAGGIAPTYAQALDEGRHYLAQYQQDGAHTLELRRVEVLGIPQEEAQR